MKPLTLGLLLALNALPTQADCWSPQDRAEFAEDEMNGRITLSLRDAVSCAPIDEARVQLGTFEFTSDARGYVQLDAPAEATDLRVPLKISKAGYFALNTELEIQLGGVVHNRFALSKVVDLDSLRLVLTWQEHPRDLDLHLEGPGFHISYQDMHDYANRARLDRDDRTGHGPETITLKRIRADEAYRVYVYNYSNERPIDRSAQVAVYAQGQLQRVIPLANSGGRAFDVLEIRDGRLIY